MSRVSARPPAHDRAAPDNYAAVTAGGMAGSVIADAAAPEAGALADGVGAAAGIHAAREANAASQGLAVRMALAVTADGYHVLDWTGGACTKEFVRFARATAQVTITKFGLSRTVRLTDHAAGTDMSLTGSTSFLSGEAAGDKIVLALLAHVGA